MGLDAGNVLKRSVLCVHCNEDYLFTLWAIADNPELIPVLTLSNLRSPNRGARWT
jgi:hypothetical protein